MARNTARSSSGIFVTDNDLSPILQVVTWLLLSITSLLLCFRLLTRFVLKANRKFGIEEVFIVSAFILGVGQSATILAPQSRIFAKDRSIITANELVAGLQAQYAGDLLFVFSACFAKLSVCASFLALSVDETHRAVTYGIACIVLMWSLSSVFGLGFQCGTHGTWHQGEHKCINQLAFIQYVCAGNLATDTLLIILPAWIVLPLNMPLTQRAAIMLFFSARIIVVVAVIVQLVFLPSVFTLGSPSQVLPYFLATQIAQSGSIATACITYFWPFMRSLRSGLFWQTNTTFKTQRTLATLSSVGNAAKTDERKDSDATCVNQISITVGCSVTSERLEGEDKIEAAEKGKR
ncbi:hypothetical protein EJ04DRAFT_552763 [Polyplosphaeria fusca]|uniref:Rhodopsin domain-containing protein n=1 Tax=Polyplosphaeria fusca TaxID=682080 RepID=A0A9P4V2N8_9PLEO|nr:hypothetical protein EJ04DRAFT_552763 [Polyplosphaeria fusca]